MPDMIVFTSAKSRLISPGTRIRSEMPWIAWRSTSSASVKASVSVVRAIDDREQPLVGDRDHRVDALAQRVEPGLGLHARASPSNLNGLVTTAMVSAPSSLARLAMTGAAPVPVPPPRPVVTKTMSAPDERLDELVGVLERGLPADVGVGAGAEALGQLAADLDA